MIAYHPDKSLLAEYSAGNLDFGPALCVTTHLEHCQQCHRELQGLATLGAVLMENQHVSDVSDDLFDRVLKCIDGESAELVQHAPAKKRMRALDKFVPQNLDEVPWQGIGNNLKSHELDVGDPANLVSLIRMRRGGTVPKHTHKGQEITMVLQGGFSDAHGSYQVGDFVECDSEVNHQPVAHQNEDCICLTSRSAPIKFTGPFMRSLNPLVRR